jgi:hypothetical protein
MKFSTTQAAVILASSAFALNQTLPDYQFCGTHNNCTTQCIEGEYLPIFSQNDVFFACKLKPPTNPNVWTVLLCKNAYRRHIGGKFSSAKGDPAYQVACKAAPGELYANQHCLVRDINDDKYVNFRHDCIANGDHGDSVVISKNVNYTTAATVAGCSSVSS